MSIKHDTTQADGDVVHVNSRDCDGRVQAAWPIPDTTILAA